MLLLTSWPTVIMIVAPFLNMLVRLFIHRTAGILRASRVMTQGLFLLAFSQNIRRSGKISGGWCFSRAVRALGSPSSTASLIASTARAQRIDPKRASAHTAHLIGPVNGARHGIFAGSTSSPKKQHPALPLAEGFCSVDAAVQPARISALPRRITQKHLQAKP